MHGRQNDVEQKTGTLREMQTCLAQQNGAGMAECSNAQSARPPRYCSGGYSHCVQKSTANYGNPGDMPRDRQFVFLIYKQRLIWRLWTIPPISGARGIASQNKKATDFASANLNPGQMRQELLHSPPETRLWKVARGVDPDQERSPARCFPNAEKCAGT